MAYKHNLPAFTPLKKHVPAGANFVCVQVAGRILRVIPSADIYVALVDSKDGLIASATNGSLLKANQEYFIDCGDKNFATFSSASADITEVRQEGLKRY